MAGPLEPSITEAPAPPTAAPPAARYINPQTGDYEVRTDGEHEGMPPVRQRAMLALGTRKRSSWALPDLGKEASPRKIDTRYEARERFSIQAALRQLTEVEKVMRLDGITFSRNGRGRVDVTVRFTDLTNGEPDSLTT